MDHHGSELFVVTLSSARAIDKIAARSQDKCTRVEEIIEPIAFYIIGTRRAVQRLRYLKNGEKSSMQIMEHRKFRVTTCPLVWVGLINWFECNALYAIIIVAALLRVVARCLYEYVKIKIHRSWGNAIKSSLGLSSSSLRGDISIYEMSSYRSELASRIRRVNPGGVTMRRRFPGEVFRKWIRLKRAFNRPRTIFRNEIR